MSIQFFERHARNRAWPTTLALAVAATMTWGTAAAADASRDLWHNATAHTLSADAPQVSVYRPLQLDIAAVRALLAPARHGANTVTLALPHPDGSFSDFTLTDSRTMPDELQDKFPEIISLAGTDALGRKARVDITPLGFQAMVFDVNGVWVVRSEVSGNGDRYLSFRREDLAVPGQKFQCDVKEGDIDASGRSLLSNPAPMTTTGTTQRVYRAAVAANHNYVGSVCPGNLTVACGLGAVVTAMNRVNQVYETEVGVHMTLIANNNTIIYPVAAGDPYSNGSGALGQNQTNLDMVIGSANYDIGHVFTTGSGGVAGLAVTCRTGQKARGTTGLPNPIGDAFYIDYVAHEMGHQFGGDHTFNSNSGFCGGNRVGTAAYEAGSGSTIMAYAGICAADDLQPHSDPYFHAKSLEQINTWISGTGGACSVATPSTDSIPVINTAALPNGLSIPAHTAFALTGTATDTDPGDLLSYDWEQYDLGPITTLAQGDTGAGPIFRSFNPNNGTRVFPKIETALGGAFVPGEAWPTTNRDLTFRLTVRDNHDVPAAPQFGITVSASNIVLHVTNTAGPFDVTRPNTALVWGRGENHLVTWNVAGTDLAPINCANVAIDLSTNSGATFGWPLSASTPNDGSATIVVPSVPDTTAARVRVSCVDNVFFDVSDVNFSIAETGTPDPTGPLGSVSPPSFTFALEAGTPDTDTLSVANGGDAASSLTYTITESSDACATMSDVAWLSASPLSGSITGGSSAPVGLSIDTDILSAGSYSASLCVATNDPAHTQFIVPVSLTVTAPANDSIFKDGFDPAGPPPQPVQDPSFEATESEGGTNPSWASLDGNPGAGGGSVFYTASGSDIPVRTGDFAVWFGGWQGGAETQTFSQSVTIPAGTPRFLNYWRDIEALPDAAGTLTVSIDGTAIETLDVSTATPTAAFVARSIDVGTYADGAAHTIQFQYVYPDAEQSGVDGDIFIDDVTIDSAAARPSVQARPQQHRVHSKRNR